MDTNKIKKLLEEVQNQTDFELNGSIRKAVICVPANTTDVYRKNVFEAAIMAGLGDIDENQNVIRDVTFWQLSTPRFARDNNKFAVPIRFCLRISTRRATLNNKNEPPVVPAAVEFY